MNTGTRTCICQECAHGADQLPAGWECKSHMLARRLMRRSRVQTKTLQFVRLFPKPFSFTVLSHSKHIRNQVFTDKSSCRSFSLRRIVDVNDCWLLSERSRVQTQGLQTLTSAYFFLVEPVTYFGTPVDLAGRSSR